MKKVWAIFFKDVRLSLKGLYFYIEIGMAVVFILIMLLAVPENVDPTQTFHVFLERDVPDRVEILRGISEARESEENLQVHESREALEQAMGDDRSSLGVVIGQKDEKPSYHLVLQGYESDRMKELLKAVIEGGLLVEQTGFQTSVVSRVLEPGGQSLTDRESILPIYLTMNVALMGLFIIAAYLFLDKDEGIIKAFAVTPARIWQYLAGKLLLMAMMGISTSVLVCLALVGTKINYGMLIGLVLAFNLFGSALGLLIASFFDTMAKAMGAMFMLIILLMAPTVSYFMPAFSPLWIRWFPTYPMLFSFRELLVNGGNQAYMFQSILGFTLLAALLFGLANRRFQKTLTV